MNIVVSGIYDQQYKESQTKEHRKGILRQKKKNKINCIQKQYMYFMSNNVKHCTDIS